MSSITVDELITKIGWKVDEASMSGAIRASDSLASRIGGSFKSMAAMILPAAGIGGLAMIATTAVTSAASLERLGAQYEVMLGSANKAKKMIADIQTLAATTPLTSLGISETVKQLLAFGIQGDKAIDTVRMLGDVAGGDQERLSRLGYAYGQTMTAGKLMGQDLLQYINVGFSPLKVMGDHLKEFGLAVGTTQGDLRKMMSEGKISAEMVTKAFQIATSAGGMFYQNMEKQSKTLGGLWSTMIDNIQINLVASIQPLIPLMKNIVNFFGQLNWGPMVAVMSAMGTGLGAMVSMLEVTYPLFVAVFGMKAIAMLRASVFWTKAAALAQTIFYTEVQIGASTTLIANNANNIWTAGVVRMRIAGAGMAAGLKTAFSSLFTGTNAWLLALAGAWLLIKKIRDDAKTDIQKASDQADEETVSSGSWGQMRKMLKIDQGMASDRAELSVMQKRSESGLSIDDTRRKMLLDRLRSNEDLTKRMDDAKARLYGETPDLISTDLLGSIQGLQVQKDITGARTVNNHIKNEISVPVTVDDKGKTPLSVDAVRALADTAVRSAFNVQFIGLSRG